ncbi:MAG: CatA-like O-acetyltransferase [Bacteroidota bacterium]
MKFITFDDPHRRKHFEFFNGMDQPHFSLVANVNIASLLAVVKEKRLPFNTAVVYVLARAANELPVFRWRIRDQSVVEHPSVQPSFTVPTEASSVFSFCTVTYDADPQVFLTRAAEVLRAMQTNPSLEDEPGRDDYLFLSAIPWVSFTSLTHAMHYNPVDSVPRISWGKYFWQGEQCWMPLGVQAHHALVNGNDLGDYYQRVQELLDTEGLF